MYAVLTTKPYKGQHSIHYAYPVSNQKPQRFAELLY